MTTESRDATLAPDRLEFVDALRGFALFGVFAANLLLFSGVNYLSNEQRAALFIHPLDGVAFFLERFFIENKFMGLFAMLFGMSFWLFLSRAQSRTGSATALFYRRIFWLFVIGAIHGWLFWCFDILRFYALWAVLLPLFVRTPPRRFLGFALTAAILLSALASAADVAFSHPDTIDYDSIALAVFTNGSYRDVLAANWQYDWYLTESIGQIGYQVAVFGRLLLGLYIIRTLDFKNLGAHRSLLRKVLIIGGIAGLVGSSIFAGQLLSEAKHLPWLEFIRQLLVEGGQLGLSLAYAAALALLFIEARSNRIVLLLAPIGKMALTFFLLQTLFGIWMFYGFAHGPALMGKVGPAALVVVGLVGYAVQVALAHAWMKRFRIGPAEWCWRSLTYGKVQSLRGGNGESPK